MAFCYKPKESVEESEKQIRFLTQIITNPYIILILNRHNSCGGFLVNL